MLDRASEQADAGRQGRRQRGGGSTVVDRHRLRRFSHAPAARADSRALQQAVPRPCPDGLLTSLTPTPPSSGREEAAAAERGGAVVEPAGTLCKGGAGVAAANSAHACTHQSPASQGPALQGAWMCQQTAWAVSRHSVWSPNAPGLSVLLHPSCHPQCTDRRNERRLREGTRGPSRSPRPEAAQPALLPGPHRGGSQRMVRPGRAVANTGR